MLRSLLERDETLPAAMTARLRGCARAPGCARLARRARARRAWLPCSRRPRPQARPPPPSCALTPGTSTTLRAELGRALHYVNAASGGAVLTASADLLGSTSVNLVGQGFAAGFWNAVANPEARQLSVGGICEDAITGVLAGVAAFGHALGAGSSYGAFMAPLGHIPARLHAIGQQARAAATGAPSNPIVLVCGHAGLKTGEDGPTHADPQALQLLQQNFPLGTAISLTPWEPQEVWPLLAAALTRRPAVISAFVTRPNETVPDRAALGLAPAAAAAEGVYVLRRPQGEPDVTVVLQESAVAYAFVSEALPILAQQGVEALVYYVASAELFDLLPAARQARDLPRGARPRGPGHHRLHAAHAVPLGALGRGPARQPVPLPRGPLPGQRPGRGGAGRRPAWTAPPRPRR